jgi:hypothetical protein
MAPINNPRIYYHQYSSSLHGMPSLLYLLSTQSELGNINVHYSGFGIDLLTPASVDDQLIINDNTITDPVIEKMLFSEEYHMSIP